MVQISAQSKIRLSGKTAGAILLGVVVGGLLVFVIMTSLLQSPKAIRLVVPKEATLHSGASSESASTKDEFERRLAREQAALASFNRAQTDYRANHRSAIGLERARRSDVRQSATLAAGSRMQRAASDLTQWTFSYPAPVSVAERINGGSRLQSVTDTLWDWYTGIERRIDALVDAECALAAAGGALRDRTIQSPSMLEMARSNAEFREPTSMRLSTHFGLDSDAATWLAAQLRPRWRTVQDKIDAGIARIEKARDSALSDAEKDQLLFNGQIRLIRAIDGDTIEILVRDRLSDAEFTDRVRLLNVDTPEIGTPGASEATSLIERECAGDLTLEFERPGQITRDRYGRVLAFVFAARTFVNAKLIERGHSRFYTEYGEGRYAQYFRYLEARAAPDEGR